jgi:hypothetical protein
MNCIAFAASLAIGVCAAFAVSAEPYVDYTPLKGGWEVITVKVDPNHVDDYLTGLKKGWVPLEETLKKHGVIDQYMILQKLNSGAGVNVELIQHYPSLAVLDPDQARDQAIQKEVLARMSKSDTDKMISGFEKYRSFDSDEMWTQVDMSK